MIIQKNIYVRIFYKIIYLDIITTYVTRGLIYIYIYFNNNFRAIISLSAYVFSLKYFDKSTIYFNIYMCINTQHIRMDCVQCIIQLLQNYCYARAGWFLKYSSKPTYIVTVL